jgi:hypothetical protein
LCPLNLKYTPYLDRIAKISLTIINNYNLTGPIVSGTVSKRHATGLRYLRLSQSTVDSPHSPKKVRLNNLSMRHMIIYEDCTNRVQQKEPGYFILCGLLFGKED